MIAETVHTPEGAWDVTGEVTRYGTYGFVAEGPGLTVCFEVRQVEFDAMSRLTRRRAISDGVEAAIEEVL